MSEYPFGPLKGGDAVAEFAARHRHADYSALEVSGPVDLFPLSPIPLGIVPGSTWVDKWPFDQRAGVYLIYAESFELLYIGKASANRRLGQRLWDHFGGGSACVLKEHWPQSPRFVVNIAVPEAYPFEAPALEEYLIRKLQPLTNTVGR